MIYTLYIWSVMTMAGGDRSISGRAYDWRPIGEFQTYGDSGAQAKCIEAAAQLGIKKDNFRCIRTK